MQVRVTNGSGSPLGGRTVTVTVSGTDTSGGHSHQLAAGSLPARPRGRLRPSGTVVSDANGTGTLTYLAPVVGGRETLTATMAGADPDSAVVTVTEPGIVEGPRVTSSYFLNPTGNHYPADAWAYAGVREVLEQMLADWFAGNLQSPDEYRFAGTHGRGRLFKVDAMALPLGGLYDWPGRWTTPHRAHREGFDVDFNDNGPSGAESVPIKMLALCARTRFLNQAVSCGLEDASGANQHYHVDFPRPLIGGLMQGTSRYARAAALAAVVGSGVASAAEAQAVGQFRFDATRGVYLVAIRGDSGFLDLIVHPANGARAEVRSTVTDEDNGRWRYRYVVTMERGATQALAAFEVPCPPPAVPQQVGGTAYRRGMRPVAIVTDVARFANRVVCEAGGRFIEAGDSLTFSFVADAGPSLASGHLIGNAPGTVWPIEFERDVNGRAKEVADSLGGITGGWRDVPVVAPLRLASALSTPPLTAAAIAAELGSACGSLGLISPAGICTSLSQKLSRVSDAIPAGRAEATNQLAAFLRELDAQRGKHVDEAAYQVLHALGLRLQSQLAP